jgi:hypothetical protein
MTKEFSVLGSQFSEKSLHGAVRIYFDMAKRAGNREVLILPRTENYSMPFCERLTTNDDPPK